MERREPFTQGTGVTGEGGENEISRGGGCHG